MTSSILSQLEGICDINITGKSLLVYCYCHVSSVLFESTQLKSFFWACRRRLLWLIITFTLSNGQVWRSVSIVILCDALDTVGSELFNFFIGKILAKHNWMNFLGPEECHDVLLLLNSFGFWLIILNAKFILSFAAETSTQLQNVVLASFKVGINPA